MPRIDKLIKKSYFERLIKNCFTIGRCGDCKFFKDDRKCPMASPEAMDEDNYCYNFERRRK